jgi:AcrR family transcriptional regulator
MTDAVATSGESAGLSFVSYLEGQLAGDSLPRKRDRTRQRLTIATARVLGRLGYHALRVIDIVTEAGLAEGSFYVYFRDKADAAAHVLRTMLEEFFGRQMKPSASNGRFEALRESNRLWIALCRNNSGLMRCALQLGDELPEFAQLVQGLNRRWHERISRSVVRHYPEGALAPENALLAAYMLGAMMDELVRRLIIYPDQDFHKLLRDLGMDDNGLADAASAIWTRVLYPGLQIDAELAPSAIAFALWAGNPPAVSSSVPR